MIVKPPKNRLIPKNILQDIKKGTMHPGYRVHMVGLTWSLEGKEDLLNQDALWINLREAQNVFEARVDQAPIVSYVAVVERVIERKQPKKRCKSLVPYGLVIKTGSATEVGKYYKDRNPQMAAQVARVVSVGNFETAKAGVNGIAVAGDYGSAEGEALATAVSRMHGTSKVGDFGLAWNRAFGKSVAGQSGLAISGPYGESEAYIEGFALAGPWGKSTVGNCGFAMAGGRGVAKAGFCGIAVVASEGYAEVEERGIVVAGAGSTVSAGPDGILIVGYVDPSGRHRKKVGYIGEDGLKPNVKYRLNDKHEFEEVNE